MNPILVKDLSDQLKALTYQCFPKTRRRPHVEGFARRTAEIAACLEATPHVPAQELARDMDLDRNEIKLAYKLIQGSRQVADNLKNSVNGDYLKIVNHYFNQKMYVVVFFVGLSCPSRCLFCPNVSESDDGRRRLTRYPVAKSDCLSPRAIAGIFEDIAAIKDSGNLVLTKISGGLEPLTDPTAMAAVIQEAKKQKVHLKLFTNGMLLESQARRRLVLGADDIRISLSIADGEKYDRVMFGKDTRRRRRYGLERVLSNIGNLVEDRNREYPHARIGVNAVVMEETHADMELLIRKVRALGVDYIDFKPDYSSPYSPDTAQAIGEVVDKYKDLQEDTRIYFAKSLLPGNLFWAHRDGICHPHKQGMFKMFITPHGSCTPVHHGAFPSSEGNGERLSCGTIDEAHSFLDIVDHMPVLPDLPQESLNPFEHMLALEIFREESDRAWGIEYEYSPYNGEMAGLIPVDLWANPAFRYMAGLGG